MKQLHQTDCNWLLQLSYSVRKYWEIRVLINKVFRRGSRRPLSVTNRFIVFVPRLTILFLPARKNKLSLIEQIWNWATHFFLYKIGDCRGDYSWPLSKMRIDLKFKSSKSTEISVSVIFKNHFRAWVLKKPQAIKRSKKSSTKLSDFWITRVLHAIAWFVGD